MANKKAAPAHPRRQQYAKAKAPARYVLEEPSSALYFRFTDEGARLARAADATRFANRESALIEASARLAGTAHELVRVDR